MFKIRNGISCLIVFLFAMIVGSFAQSAESPDYFPLPIGAVWKYKFITSGGQEFGFTQQVIEAEKQDDGSTWYKVEVVSTEPIYTWFSKSDGWVLMHREKSSGYDGKYTPAKKYLKDPMLPGDTWEWKGIRPGVQAVDLEESNQVVEIEEVVVPAGTFKAIKVVTDVVQAGTSVKRTYWYADGVGFVKGVIESSSFKSTSELIEYSLK
jgi:hypothetical protein